jgi:hypothetical protein
MPQLQSKLVRNERRKLTATLLNTLAAGSLLTAIIGPAVGFGDGTAHLLSVRRWLLGAMIWGLVGLGSHLMALARIGWLEE